MNSAISNIVKIAKENQDLHKFTIHQLINIIEIHQIICNQKVIQNLKQNQIKNQLRNQNQILNNLKVKVGQRPSRHSFYQILKVNYIFKKSIFF